MQLLIATRNKGKVAEFADMLSDLEIEWLDLADLNLELDVAETGQTFAENAALKAAGYARAAGMMTLADDSGLEVDALNGAPGLYTARFGGAELSTEERYRFLLSKLNGIPPEKRTARFRAVIAVADKKGEILTSVEGVCPGRIALAPRGSYGFGYDPVFLPDGEGGKTMAELPPAVKHPLSHRGRAIAVLAPFLRRLMDEGT